MFEVTNPPSGDIVLGRVVSVSLVSIWTYCCAATLKTLSVSSSIGSRPLQPVMSASTAAAGNKNFRIVLCINIFLAKVTIRPLKPKNILQSKREAGGERVLHRTVSIVPSQVKTQAVNNLHASPDGKI